MSLTTLSSICAHILTKRFFTTYTILCRRPLHSTIRRSTTPMLSNVIDNSVMDNSELKTDDKNQIESALVGLSPEDAKKLKVLKLEFDVFYSTGVRVPDQMLDSHWLQALQCPSPMARKRYYSYLFRNEKVVFNKKLKAIENLKRSNENYLKQKELFEEGLAEAFKNTFLLKIIPATVNKHQNNNLCYAMMNGPHLIFDAGFDNLMSKLEINDLGKQLEHSHGANKEDPSPFHFHFCNLNKTEQLYTRLKKSMDPDKVIMSHTSQNYMDIYPKERLVYLSPNAPKVLKDYNHDDIYIIGCIVDKSNELPLTLARAKEYGIRTCRLPIDEHIKWIHGSKSLTLNQIVSILLDVKAKKSWFDAFVKNLPKRKIFDYDEGKYTQLKKNSKFYLN